MNPLQIKRHEFSSKIRRLEKENYFKNIRLSLLTPPELYSHIQLTASGQKQILDMVLAFQKEKQLLNFAAINHYVEGYKGPLSEQFKFQVVSIILKNYRMNGHAIACMANILVKCQDSHYLTQIEGLKEQSKLIIVENILEQRKELTNARAIAFLFFGLLNCVENRQDYAFLTQYYQLFADNIGFFDQALLLLLETCSHQRTLLPSESFINTLLTQDNPLDNFSFGQLDPINLMVLCEFLQNYVCLNLSLDVYHFLSRWVLKRLKQRKFSISLKKNLIKIVSIAISYEQIANFLNKQLHEEFKIFQQISMLSRFGTLQVKEEALICLTSLAQNSCKNNVEFLIQHIQLLEILVFSLELNNQDVTFKVLDTITILLSESQRYCKMAMSYGLLSQLIRLISSDVVKISESAQHLLEMIQNQ